MDPSTHNLVWMLKLMIPHIDQETLKRFITHIMRPSGKRRGGPQVDLQMAGESRERRGPGVLWCLGSGACVRVSACEQNLCGLNFLLRPKEEAYSFLIGLLRYGRWWGLKAVSKH